MNKKETKAQDNTQDKLSVLDSFRALGLKDKVLKGIKEAGFTTPSPIQERAIPPILERRDVIAQAQTGTGKTAAFALPILHSLKNDSSIEALVITPTRELAMQISDEVFKLGKFLKTKTVCVYGGQSVKKQLELIEKKPQVLIATPGRLLDHLKNERLKNFAPNVVVLDESDEMLDMGFIDDIEEIFQYIPNNAQTLLFSATMPARIKQLADKILYDPVHIKIQSSSTTNSDIAQRYYIINENERNEALTRLIDTESPSKSIIFIRTKKEADEVNSYLQNKGYKSTALHGDMDQRMRRDSVQAFKGKEADILVATDVAARGLDIRNVSHVFNYHIPLNIESYVHRIGRTGRAGSKGVAITLATPLEYKDLKKIQNETNAKFELYEVPSVSSDVMINTLLNTKVSDEAINLYESIKDKTDSAQLILRLLSVYLREHVKIGLTKQEALEVQKQEILESKKEAKTKGNKGTKGKTLTRDKNPKSSTIDALIKRIYQKTHDQATPKRELKSKKCKVSKNTIRDNFAT
ncbi:DEAD/DEAH box helicase [Helicobacter bilis]|uniref:DEAD/DEAH box helicase n=1 Tax=Helicobacter bilis TaxID=37372 RepID=UPI0012DB3C56